MKVFKKILSKSILWVMILVILGVVLVLGAGISNVIMYEIADNIDKIETEESHQFNIYALQDNQTYIISRYSSENKQLYNFMRKSNGGYKSGYIPASKTTVYETESNPRIEVYKEIPSFTPEWFNNISGRLEIYHVDSVKYRLYVPKGTIKEEFDIDLK